MIEKRYKGRVVIDPDALSALFGLPEEVESRIYYDPITDSYQLIMRSEQPVTINGEPVTTLCMEGCTVEQVPGSFLARAVIIPEDISSLDDYECFNNAVQMKAAL